MKHPRGAVGFRFRYRASIFGKASASYAGMSQRNGISPLQPMIAPHSFPIGICLDQAATHLTGNYGQNGGKEQRKVTPA